MAETIAKSQKNKDPRTIAIVRLAASINVHEPTPTGRDLSALMDRKALAEKVVTRGGCLAVGTQVACTGCSIQELEPEMCLRVKEATEIVDRTALASAQPEPLAG